jgi:hypothetical protein
MHANRIALGLAAFRVVGTKRSGCERVRRARRERPRRIFHHGLASSAVTWSRSGTRLF